MEFKKLKIDTLIPASYNPRKALKPGDPEFEKIKNSITEFGYVDPIIVNSDMTIIGGHQRWSVLKALGYDEVDCVVIEIDKTKEKALNIALNKVTGEWNKELLADLIKDLQSLDYDVSMTGFEPPEIDELFNDVHSKDVKDDKFDLDKALDDEAFVKSGDVWLLGRHRLMCGDSTKPDNISMLMNGKKANLCITDPPYNCSYEGGTGMRIMNDNWSDSQKFYQFLLDAFKNAYGSMADGAAIYVFHSDAEKVNFFNAVVNVGFHYSTTCIWVKNALVIGRMDFQMRHEPIIYGFKDTAKHKFYGDRKQTTVWEFDKPVKSKLHPTTKPLALMGYPIGLSSQENGIILDLFGGSGSTLIAAEQMNRIGYLMELDPIYASVIVRRYAAFKGGIDEIKVIRDGKTYDGKEIYVPSEHELEYKETSVFDAQKGRSHE